MGQEGILGERLVMTVFQRTYVLESYGRLIDSGLSREDAIACVVSSFHLSEETVREIVGWMYPIDLPREITT